MWGETFLLKAGLLWLRGHIQMEPASQRLARGPANSWALIWRAAPAQVPGCLNRFTQIRRTPPVDR
jgi:hypothetical protein